MADIDDPRFTRTFELPANTIEGQDEPLKIAYADFGYRNEASPEQENVLLFFSPLLGSRLLHISKDELAKKSKIRIICPDRPGIGSTDIWQDDGRRMMLWREASVALLNHLNLEHVSVACHSGGTLYAVDFLMHHPEFLIPDRPYFGIGGPWIVPAHTNSISLAMAHALPASVIGYADGMARFITGYAGPVIGVSAGISSVITSVFKSPADELDISEERKQLGKYEEELLPKIIKQVYKEGVTGLGNEAVLFLHKGPNAEGPSGWSDWGDYDKGIPRLAEALRTVLKPQAPLQVEVFYSQSDDLIGAPDTKGPLWFDNVWGSDGNKDVVKYNRRVIKGAEHETVWHMRFGAIQTMFGQVGEPVNEEVSVGVTEHTVL